MRKTHTAVILLVVSILVGCSSVTPMDPDPEVVRAAIRPGDKVYIRTTDDDVDGKWYTVDKVSETSITSDDKTILYADIRMMEKLEAPDITNDESKIAGRIGIGLLVSYLIIGSIFGF
jgi:hypothetical protein